MNKTKAKDKRMMILAVALLSLFIMAVPLIAADDHRDEYKFDLWNWLKDYFSGGITGAAVIGGPAACGSILVEDTTLNADVTGCARTALIVDASDITLDCQGFTVEFDNDGVDTGNTLFDPLVDMSHGVEVRSENNVVIKNCNIVDLTATGLQNSGVRLMATTNSKVIDNTMDVKGSIPRGVQVAGQSPDEFGTSSGNVIANNTITITSNNNSAGFFDAGIHLNGVSTGSADDNLITTNTITVLGIGQQHRGVYMNRGFTNVVSNNSITINSGGALNQAIYVTGIPGSFNNHTLTGNTISVNGTLLQNLGISLLQTNGNLIENNTIVTDGDQHANSGMSIAISHNTTIRNNSIRTNGTNVNHGIALDANEGNVIYDNRIVTGGTQGSNHGIHTTGFGGAHNHNNTISNNTILATGASGVTGFFLRGGTSQNVFSGNDITVISQASDNVGFWVAEFSHDNVVTNNNIQVTAPGSRSNGMRVTNSVENEVSFNTVSIAGNPTTRKNNGMRILNANDSLIANNTILAADGVGINLTDTFMANITGNSIAGTSLGGIHLGPGSNNQVLDNAITITSSPGILIAGGTANLVTGNTVDGAPISLKLSGTTANTIFQNNFIQSIGFVDSDAPVELSFNGEGSHWGRVCPGGNGFVAGVDSNAVDVIDSFAYGALSEWDSAGVPCASTPQVCGDDILQTGEGCDDGNTLPGDDCSPTCEIEDTDGDGISDLLDNCPLVSNLGQENSDASLGGNLAVGGTASASTAFNADNGADKAFDGDPTSFGWGNTNVLPSWLEYDFGVGNAKVLTKYTIIANSAQVGGWILEDYNPKTWTFEGSHDGINWDVLDTVADGDLTKNQLKEFTFANIVSYQKYRIHVTASELGTWLHITEMELFGPEGDSFGDACDNCRFINNEDQLDSNGNCPAQPFATDPACGDVCEVAVCGDGLVEGAEACDDGNVLSSDGCSATCDLEFGFSCVGEPSVCTVSSCTSAPANLFTWWDGDDVSGPTATDITGGNDATLVNGATTAPGLVGDAFSFDGVDDYLQATVPQPTNTISYWAKKPAENWHHYASSGGVQYLDGVASGFDNVHYQQTGNDVFFGRRLGNALDTNQANRLFRNPYATITGNSVEMSFWIFPQDVGVSRQGVFSTGGDTMFFEIQADGTLFFGIRFNGLTAVQTPFAVNPNQWYYITVFYDDVTKNFGLAVDDQAPIIGNRPQGINLGPGLDIGSGLSGFHYTGRIDSFGHWNRLLTPAERTILYQNGKGLTYDELPAGLKTGLFSFWDMEEATGTRVDSHGVNDLTDAFSTPNAPGVTNAGHFNGLIDEIQLYDRDLSGAEVQNFFTAGSAGVCKAACTAPPGNVLSWWDGDAVAGGIVSDLINANDGTLVGATQVPAKVGQGFGFDGVDDTVNIPYTGLALNTYSYSFWAQSDNAGGPNQIMITQDVGGLNQCHEVEYDVGTQKVTLSAGQEGFGRGVVSATHDLSTFSHIAVTSDQTTNEAILYINGQRVGSSITAPCGQAFNNRLRLGLSPFDTQAFDGILDEVAIWDKVLTPQEVQALFSADSAGMCKVGCNSDVDCAAGQVCSGTSQCTLPICGNALTDTGETCDDGNLISLDGCSASCAAEVCGDGVLHTGEECDDGNVLSGDTCSATCEFESLAACSAKPATLVSWWSGDTNTGSDVFDVESTNTGIFVGDTTVVAGKVGLAFDFSGGENYVDVDAVLIDQFEPEFSYSTWVRPRSLPFTSGGGIMSQHRGGLNSAYALHQGTFGDLRFSVLAPGGVTHFLIGPNMPLDVWTHAVVTVDATTMRLYFNGVEVDSTPRANEFAPSVSSFRFGCSHFSRCFNGAIDEPMVFTRALGAAEISAMFTADSAGVCRVDTFSTAGGPNMCTFFAGEGDNCPNDANPGQEDLDLDGIGDVCDPQTCGNGITEGTEQCDGEVCCSASCTYASAAVECRGSAGVCDAVEQCTGASATCPSDTFAPASTECRASAGTCDVAEQCSGSSVDCPADVLATSGTECRGAAGLCDVAEQCDGLVGTCPVDVLVSAGTQCRGSAGVCDVVEQCDGLVAACPVDGFAPLSTECPVTAPNAQNHCDGTGALACVCNPTGIPESLCSGFDDDCDSLIDEDFVAEPTTCGFGLCASTGALSCGANGIVTDTCTVLGAPEPLKETSCSDGLDNDCDGFTDTSDSDCPGHLLVFQEFNGVLNGDQFGFSVSDAGNMFERFDDDDDDSKGITRTAVIVGAPGVDRPELGGFGEDAGNAFVFLDFDEDDDDGDDDDGPGFLRFVGPGAYRLGQSVGSVGDINGDGVDDVVVGVPFADDLFNFNFDAGRAVVLSGRTSERLLVLSSFEESGVLHSLNGLGNGDNLGWSVAGAGDVNNDGTPDIIAGGLFNDAGGVNAGTALVFSGLDGTLLHQFNGQERDEMGTSVAAAGDLNSDGYADVIVGAPFADPNGVNDAGSAFVFSGFDGSLLQRFDGLVQLGKFGDSVSGLGDVSGDGKPELLIGASDSSPGALDGAGSAFVYSIDAPLVPIYQFDGSAPLEGLGSSLANAGDMSGDGVDDIVVGSPRHNVPDPLCPTCFPIAVEGGKVTVFSGADGGVLASFEGELNNDHLGTSVSSAGDRNGDGRDEVIVGAPGDPFAATTPGRAVILGLVSGFLIDSCTDITGPGDYILTQDVTRAGGACHAVNANDVTLDCLGHSIKLGGSRTVGVLIRNVDNTKVRNCNFEQDGSDDLLAVELLTSSNTQLEKVDIDIPTAPSSTGVLVDGGQPALIKQSKVVLNGTGSNGIITNNAVVDIEETLIQVG